MTDPNKLMQFVSSQVFDEFCPKLQMTKHKSDVSELRRRVCAKCDEGDRVAFY